MGERTMRGVPRAGGKFTSLLYTLVDDSLYLFYGSPSSAGFIIMYSAVFL